MHQLTTVLSIHDRDGYDYLVTYLGRLVLMVLSIKSEEADRLARELASVTGESLTDAVTEALRERLAATRRQRRGLAARLLQISEVSAARPRLDVRSDDEILGYGPHGLPT